MKNIVISAIVFLVLCPYRADALRVEQGEPAASGNSLSAASAAALTGPLRVTLRPVQEKVRLGDLVDIEVEIIAQPNITLLKNEYSRKLGDWDVVAVQAGETKYENGTFIRVDHLTLQTFSQGEVEIPAVVQKFKDPGGNLAEFHSAPISMTVDPLPPKKGDRPGDIRGLKDPRDMLSWWMVGVVALFLLLSAALLAWSLMRRRKTALAAAEPAPLLPPEDVARERLRVLRNSACLADGNFKYYYSELADILRRYLEGIYKVPAIDRTTHELMRELKNTSLARSELNNVRIILDQSDMVKFAKYLPDEEDAVNDWQLTTDIVEKTITAYRQDQIRLEEQSLK